MIALRRALRPSCARGVAGQLRCASDGGSHDDFAPVRKAPDSGSPEELTQILQDQVDNHKVMLYMKGTPSQPQCGFSSQVVRILHQQGVDFDAVNVLQHDEIRHGIKEFSNWPTIPQLYIGGEFVGGCDIVTSMHQSGELAELLAEVGGSDE
eukprot:g6103.t1